MVTAELRHMTWTDFGEATVRLTAALRAYDIDLVVGIAKGGLPLAVALCHGLGVPAFGTLHLFQSASDAALDLRVTDPVIYKGAILPRSTFRRVAIVDDVVTKGLVMGEAERIVRDRYGPGVRTLPVTTFADRRGIDSGPARDLGERLVADQEIDNTRVWIVFPWENAT